MEGKKIKWLIYTVLVGLIPILCRMLMWVVTKNGTVQPWAAADFIAFGLVLHISNINEIEHLDGDRDWKTTQNGISIAFIAFYSVLFALSMLQGGAASLVNSNTITVCALSLATVSLLISFSIFHRLSSLARARSAT